MMYSPVVEVTHLADEDVGRPKPRKLAPKPLNEASSKLPRIRRKLPSRIPSRVAHGTRRQCAVCRRIGCELRSHKAFISLARATPAGCVASDSEHGDGIYTKSYAYFYAQQYIDSDLASGKVDPFHDLPISGQRPELHKLFHDYFVQLKASFRFPLPAGMPGDLIGGALLMPAMSDTAVCLSVLATAASWPTVRAGLPPSVEALTLHTQAIQSLRERLYPGPTRITDGTLLAAILIWAMELLQSSLPSISAHARSVHSLVLARGGLLALYHTPAILQLIIWLDALTGQILEEEMRFKGIIQEPNAANLDLPIRKYGDQLEQVQSECTGSGRSREGSGLHSALYIFEPSCYTMNSVDPDLIRIFTDMCRATEVLEDAVQNGIGFPMFQYAMTLLNFVIARMAVIHARYKDTRTWDRCICIALNIYYLTTFHPGQEIRPFPLRLCARLRVALDLAMVSNLPLSNDILLWIACVVAIVPHHFDGRDYFLDIIWRAVTIKFRTREWPHGWEAGACQSLRSFVWSDKRHAPAFDKICCELRQRTTPAGVGS